MVQKITQAEFQDKTKDGTVVVDFSAVWCGPCQMLAPVLEQISEEMEGKIRFFNVDVDENMDLAQEYMVTNVPALLVLKDGKKQGMLVGFKPKDALMDEIKAYL